MPLLADFKTRLSLPKAEERALPPVAAVIPSVFTPPPTATGPAEPWPPYGAQTYYVPPKVLAGGRLSWDDLNLWGAGLPVILPPSNNAENWRRLDLDADSIRCMPVTQLLEVLADASPDVARALWDFLRLCNPGWTVTAYKPNSETPHPEGQKAVDDWLRKLNKKYGTVDVPINRLHLAAYLRGAMFSELVLDDDAQTPIDLATPDPITARFKQVFDPTYGRVWLLGQFQMGQWVDLSHRETISYIPVDPLPTNPYGRAPANPAIFSSLFLVGLLTDLRRVVAQQGYPRYDLSVSLEALRKSTPPNILQDPVQWKTWVDTTINEVQKAYNALEPDSAFVHTDVVVVNKPTGAVSADALAGIDPLIRALERQLARALKTMPLLMGIIEGQSEANANRQWELQAAGVKAIQHLAEAQLSEWATLCCEAQGIDAQCTWRFAELRAAEKYRDAMTEGLNIDNATKLYFMGVIGQDEMAERLTGLAPDQKEPRLVPSTEIPYTPGVTTNSPRADLAPAGSGSGGGVEGEPKDKIEAGEHGGTMQQQPGKSWFGVRWPELRLNWRSNGKKASPPSVFKPLGLPLAYVPPEVTYDDGDRRRVVREWDETVQEASGLLDARVTAPTLPSEPESVRDATDALRDVAKEVRELIAASNAPPKRVRKVVERDSVGRITAVTEVPEE